MPNINNINGVTVANLAKLDAVLKANISKVNGLSFAAATGLLADYPGAAAAYSTRQLLSTVTVAMRIRRSGDDIEADVEFDSNNEISLTSPISNASSGTYTDLADFVDHSTTPRDAFVDEWKDQSGSGNHAAQATAGSQPKLYDATTGLITDNGKPALDFDGSDDHYDIASSLGITGSQARSTFFVLRPEAAGSSSSYQTYFGLGDDGTASNGQIWDLWPEWSVRVFGGFEKYNTVTINAQYLSTNILSGTNVTDNAFFLDGAEQTATSSSGITVNTDNTVQRIGRTGSGAFTGPYFTGKMQEIVIYASAQTSNRNGIETNINSDYLIYQPTDAPTSGLLATYTGAAVAYSVRQLSDKAVIAMRIRRDSDDEERNIGFDSNGDLDTTAISDFCDTANGYVVEWADQSTNGNHATQSTAGSQPQIYNGTAVITVESGGKPALFCTDSNDGFSAAAGAIDVTSRTIYQWSVYSLTGTGNYPTITPSAVYEGHNVGTEVPRTGTNRSTFAGVNAASAINTNQAYLRHSYADTTDFKTFLDGSGTAIISGTDTNADWATSGLQIFDTNLGATGQLKLSEFIMWQSDQSTNRTGIESDINTYFSIY